MKMLMGIAIAALTLLSCSASIEADDLPSVLLSTSTIEPCVTTVEMYAGGSAGYGDTITCRDRILELEAWIPRVAEDLADWPQRYRAESVAICDNGRWADYDMGFDSFGDCVQVQLEYFESTFEVVDPLGDLNGLRRELEELRVRLAGQ